MPINKLALIRYKTIDNCLQNRYRNWTLDDLIEACSDALYEFEGIKKGVSRRTVQLDIQNMRSEKLGYNAPIVVTDRKYYTYEDKNYSITNSPVTLQELNTLGEVIDVLKQFSGFGFFHELTGVVTRLEDKLNRHRQDGKSFIDFEKNELLKGLNHIDPLLKAIRNQKTIGVVYQSFKSKNPQAMVVYPYLLKEYRNRWFLLGTNKKGRTMSILALDRIEQFHVLEDELFLPPLTDMTTFFNDAIGVSKMPGQKPYLVVMKIAREHAPYILTKPFHPSQKILKEEDDGMIFSVEVIWNFELEREILGFGEHIRVLSPKRLCGKVSSRLKKSLENYQTPLPSDPDSTQ